MQNSRVVRRIYKPDTDTKLTTGYFRKGKRNVPNYIYDHKMKPFDGIVGDGGIHSTLLDLLKWKEALKNNSIVSQQSKESMFSGDSISHSDGLGFGIKNDEKLGKYVWHNGAWLGYSTVFLYILSSDEMIVILSNNEYKNNGQIGSLLLRYGR
jgi:CubicO group peptidase (beta-lactamase class C family)